MFLHRLVVVALSAALVPTAPLLAQERSHTSDAPMTVEALPSIGPLQASIDRVQFGHANAVRTDATTANETSMGQASQSGGVLGKVVMAGVLGVAGFLGGGYLGAKIEGPCDCDDPGFKGAIIGAPIGAAVGAIAGWKLSGLLSQ